MTNETVAIRSCQPVGGDSCFYVVEIRHPRSTESFRATARPVEALETRHFASLGDLCQFFRSHVVIAEPDMTCHAEAAVGDRLASGSQP